MLLKKRADKGIGYMTVDEVMAVIGRITYKPGWRLETRPSSIAPQSVHLYLTFESTDSITGAQDTWVASNNFIDPRMVSTPEQVVDWVKRCITDLEHHERDEWLRFDGDLVHDPHAADFRYT